MSVPGLSGLAMSVNLSPNVSRPGFDRGQCQNKPDSGLEGGGWDRERGRGESWPSIYIKLKVGFSLRHM